MFQSPSSTDLISPRLCLRGRRSPSINSRYTGSLTVVNFVVCFEVPLLVKSPATDGAAVWFLSRVNQFMALQFVGMRKLFAAHGALVVDLFFGLLQELGGDFYWDAQPLPPGGLFDCEEKKKNQKHVRGLESGLLDQLYNQG